MLGCQEKQRLLHPGFRGTVCEGLMMALQQFWDACMQLVCC